MSEQRQGRPRSVAAGIAVLEATRELVNEEGFAHVTIEKIAARAKVGKPTIYRRWQSKNAILAECVLQGQLLPEMQPATTLEGARVNAEEWINTSLAFVDENAGLLRGVVAASYEDDVISAQLNTAFVVPITAALTESIKTASSRPVTEEISVAALAELIYGTILFRLATRNRVGPDTTKEIFHLIASRLSEASSTPS